VEKVKIVSELKTSTDLKESEITVEKICRVIKLFRNTYYRGIANPKPTREQVDNEILAKIREIHKTHPCYGLDPIAAEIKEKMGHGKRRVKRLMRANGIHSKRKIKWKATTNSNHKLPVAPNLLKQNFKIDFPNRIWVGDITYNWTEEGWLYTAIVKDLCTKDVVGWSIGERMTKELVIRAFEMAVKSEKPEAGLIFHSDRGSQYCSKEYRELLKRNGIVQSMSNKGNPYDNACAENFFSCLKCECTNFYYFRTRAEARAAIFEYIAIYYNRQRRHGALKWMTPINYKIMLKNQSQA